jgi:iron complex outermembrane receptor protein
MQMRHKQRSGLKLLPLAVAVLAGLHANAAFAQSEADAQEQPAQQEQEQAGEKKAVTDLDRLTVTGSLIRRVEYDTISPVQVITADTSVAVGQVSASEFLQQSSVAAGSTQINNQFSGFVVEGGTGVSTLSLRGLGPQRTLVLLNGRRPGPAGTRGQVAAFDLNVLPSSILQRAEILKDGSSSIYGSDAVAGVVNLITRNDIDGPEFTFTTRAPLDGGGEVYSAAVANGWSFNNGGVMVAAEYYLHEPLLVKDRDFFQCGEDLAFDQQGNRIDREDRSITAGTSLGGCNNLYANTVIEVFGARNRYIPSPDGETIGLIPGYRPRTNGTYRDGGQAYYEDVLNFDFYGDTQIIDRQERKSVFVSGDYLFGDISWTTELLYNNRETESHRYRQFFPLIGGATAPFAVFRYADSPTYVAPVPSGLAQPVMPFLSDQKIEVDYFYINTGLDGYFGDTWGWQADVSHTRSEGKYSSLGIVASRSGDVQFDSTAPRLNYFDPGFLSGERMDELVAAVGQWDTGETVYEQTVATGLLSGELFTLPAGAAGAALGFEHRRFSIDDQPGVLSRTGDLWGQSSAQVTKGEDRVNEIFGEIEVPLIAGKPGFERLTVNASARAFQYDTVPGTNEVWKLGLGWQMTPSFQLRATKGTSYRAPGLFELFLGNQTGFQSQLAIDPCIDWAEDTNTFLRQNCAAAGVPGDYTGGGSSATIISGGGFGLLESETSRAFTTGFIFTPTFADLSIAFDYFDIEINDQIDRLGARAILGGCYGSPNYPNAYCDLFERNSPTDPVAPNSITTVRDFYLNVNQQVTRGYDLLVRYENELPFGNLEVEGQFTYVIEDLVRLFDPDQASGFDSDDLNGSIGRPKLVGNLRTAFERGDWTYTWGMNYVHGTKDLNLSPQFDYFAAPGTLNGVRDIRAERRVYHTASVQYRQDKWSVLVGIQNLLDEEPPVVSSGVASRYGNVPAFATQYDWYGRSLFARFNYKF